MDTTNDAKKNNNVVVGFSVRINKIMVSDCESVDATGDVHRVSIAQQKYDPITFFVVTQHSNTVYTS